MMLWELLRKLNDEADSFVREQRDSGLKGAAVKEPDVFFFLDDGLTEAELVAVEQDKAGVHIFVKRME
jgi:hypothetical protein